MPDAGAPTPHLGPIDDDRSRPARFEARELGAVLGRYDLGIVRRLRAFSRGSRRAPKLRIEAAHGDFLLKRRAPGRDDVGRVRFGQSMQLHLAAYGYPVAELVPTRDDGRTILELGERVYEMFRFVEGEREDGSLASAERAGRALGLLHRLLAGHMPAGAPGAQSYHAAPALDAALRQVPAAVAGAAGRTCDDLGTRCGRLAQAYAEAARRAEEAGFAARGVSLLHGDWHPGNILYQAGEIAAVLDFDSARSEPRAIDIANGALQFSLLSTDRDNPARWPAGLDVRRIRALLLGYDEAAAERLSVEERRALPWLIVEALISESVMPIAATGRFAHHDGAIFLEMVERKATWVHTHSEKLIEYLVG